MGDDLANADAVDTALAYQRTCAAHDAIPGQAAACHCLSSAVFLAGRSSEQVYLGAMTIVIAV